MTHSNSRCCLKHSVLLRSWSAAHICCGENQGKTQTEAGNLKEDPTVQQDTAPDTQPELSTGPNLAATDNVHKALTITLCSFSHWVWWSQTNFVEYNSSEIAVSRCANLSSNCYQGQPNFLFILYYHCVYATASLCITLHTIIKPQTIIISQFTYLCQLLLFASDALNVCLFCGW